MLKSFKKLSIGLGVALLMVSCSKDMESVTPVSTLNGVSINDVKANSATAFQVSTEISSSNGNNTWSFTVHNTGSKTGANANSVMLALKTCNGVDVTLSPSNVVSLTVQRAGGPVQNLGLSFIESSSNACAMAGTPGYVRFADFVGNVKDGAMYTFAVTLNSAIKVTSATVGIKAGNECIPGSMTGTTCEPVAQIAEVMCGVGHGSFKKINSWQGKSVTIGGHTYNEADGLAIFDLNAGNTQIAFAFMQAATVELNKQLNGLSASAFATEMAAINTYLSTMDKLTATTGNAAYDSTTQAKNAKSAAGDIGDNIKCGSTTGN